MSRSRRSRGEPDCRDHRQPERSADGDGRDPAQARAADAPCDRVGCVADLPEGESLSIVLDRLAFDEDCARAEVVVSGLTAPQGCKAKFVLDEQALGRLGAVGLSWSDEKGFALASDRSALQNRPWSPAPGPARDDRLVRPGHGGSHGADPADQPTDPDADH